MSLKTLILSLGIFAFVGFAATAAAQPASLPDLVPQASVSDADCGSAAQAEGGELTKEAFLTLLSNPMSPAQKPSPKCFCSLSHCQQHCASIGCDPVLAVCDPCACLCKGCN